MLSWDDMRMFLGPELNAGIDVASGEKSIDEAVVNYAAGQAFSGGVDSLGGTDALSGATDNVDAATEQFAQAGQVNPALKTQNLSAPVVDAQTFQPGDLGPEMPQVNQAFPNDTSLSNSANINIGDNAVTGPQFESYGGPTTSPANLPEPEAPGTFLGLEGKDYTKMGMQGVMAAGVSAAQPTPVQPSKAPAGPGITKGNPIPQGGMQGVNSMVAPDPRLNSMQMTQTQGLISPFQQDMRRRRGY